MQVRCPEPRSVGPSAATVQSTRVAYYFVRNPIHDHKHVMHRLPPLAVALGAALACTARARGPCDPLVPEHCLFPFPNDFYRDASAGRLTLAAASLPVDGNGVVIDPDFGGWNGLDGFSPSGPILTYMANLSLELGAPPRFWNVSRSLDASSPTVLLDAATGARVAHWVELDHSSDRTRTGEYRRALIINPAARLEDARRYIVAIRGLSDADGRPIAASAAFAALRDGKPSSDPDVESRREHFADIFAKLGAAGVRRPPRPRTPTRLAR